MTQPENNLPEWLVTVLQAVSDGGELGYKDRLYCVTMGYIEHNYMTGESRLTNLGKLLLEQSKEKAGK